MKVSSLLFCAVTVLLLLGKSYTAEVDTATALAAQAPGTFFLQDEPLVFAVSSPLPEGTVWTLTDWQDKPIVRGKMDKGGLTLAPLPNGYYKIFLTGENATFKNYRSFIVGPSLKDRKVNPDSFFCLDTANTWLSSPRRNRQNSQFPEDAFVQVADVAQRMGAAMIRERLRWHEIEPRRGEFNWNPKGFPYADNYNLMSERGIGISTLFHDTPAWAKDGNPLLPGDLGALYDFCKALATKFKGKVNLWEFWNEQDNRRFSKRGAWEYASTLKAAYLGFKAGDPHTEVTMGDSSPMYFDVLMLNKVQDYTDVFNDHSYSYVKQYPNSISSTYHILDSHGMGNRPLYFTESGSKAEGDTGKLNSYKKGCREHSPEQELIVAEFLPKMMLMIQSQGAEKDFVFVLPPINEAQGMKVWGLMRFDFTCKPAVAAYSNLTYMVGNAKSLGTMDLGNGVKGNLYEQEDGSQTMVYWLLSKVDTTDSPVQWPEIIKTQDLVLQAKAGSYTGTTVFGTPFIAKAGADGLKLSATRMPAYINGLSGLKPTTPFVARKTSGSPEKVAYDRDIVYRVKFTRDIKEMNMKCSADVKGECVDFTVQVWNFADKEKSGKLNITGGKVLKMSEGELKLPPFGKVEIPVTFAPALDGQFKGRMEVNGKFNGVDTSPLVVPLINTGKLYASYKTLGLERMMDSDVWRGNSSGKMTITYDMEKEAVKFVTKFPPNVDRWIWPEFRLLLPDESIKGAAAISYDFMTDDMGTFELGGLMIVDKRSKQKAYLIRKPSNGLSNKWIHSVIPFDTNAAQNPDNTVAVRIGMNAKSDIATFWVKNVKVYYGESVYK